MSDPVSAYRQGVEAYLSGVPLDANPYTHDPTSQNHQDWNDGRRGVTPSRWSSVRAKFRCLEVARKYTHTSQGGTTSGGGITPDIDHFSYRVKLVPVMAKSKTGGYDPGSDNAAFFAATPSGEIEFTNLAESAAVHFVPGQAYHIDFTPVDG